MAVALPKPVWADTVLTYLNLIEKQKMEVIEHENREDIIRMIDAFTHAIRVKNLPAANHLARLINAAL